MEWPVESESAHDCVRLAARALLASRMGHHDAAEAWFKSAIDSAPDAESKAALVYRSALATLRRGRTDAIPMLERYARIPTALSAALNATLATAYVLADRPEEARRIAHRARDVLTTEEPVAQRPRTLYQIAYVGLRTGDFTEAKTFAHEAVEAARRVKDNDLLARGYSLLYEIAHHIDCDPAAALRYVELVDACASQTGDVYVRAWALMAAFFIEIEAGNDKAARVREQALSVIDIVQSAELTSETLVPGQALRSAWQRDFSRAHRLVAESAESQGTPDRRACRFAKAALYAAAAGEIGPARDAIESAEWTIAHSRFKSKAHVEALAYCALAAALATGVESAEKPMRRLRALRSEVPRSMEALIDAVEAIYESWSGAANHSALLDAFAALRAEYLGGISMLLEVLPIAS